jgi:FKBP-type peptidyl-prolyl cis-trans isomerase FklB
MKSHWIHGVVLGSIASVACLQAHAADDATIKTTTTSATTESTQTSADPAEKAQKDGEVFMEKNKKEAGMVTLPSGLQYKIVDAGEGKKPSKSDTVTVDYEGTLLNGTVFDSSYKRGQPASFPVSGVIAGWTEALQLMPTGATWMLYIPPHLAYGKAGAGGLIGPNETLVFKVHLISIK